MTKEISFQLVTLQYINSSNSFKSSLGLWSNAWHTLAVTWLQVAFVISKSDIASSNVTWLWRPPFHELAIRWPSYQLETLMSTHKSMQVSKTKWTNKPTVVSKSGCSSAEISFSSLWLVTSSSSMFLSKCSLSESLTEFESLSSTLLSHLPSSLLLASISVVSKTSEGFSTCSVRDCCFYATKRYKVNKLVSYQIVVWNVS